MPDVSRGTAFVQEADPAAGLPAIVASQENDARIPEGSTWFKPSTGALKIWLRPGPADPYEWQTVSSSASGGGVTVDNGTDPPAEVTTIVAAGASIEAGTATLPEGGGLSNPLLEPLTITSSEPNVLVVNGAPATDASDLFLFEADDANVFFGNTAGQGEWNIQAFGSAFVFKRSSNNSPDEPGNIMDIDEYGIDFTSGDGERYLYLDRESIGGGIRFFGGAVMGRDNAARDAIADATDPASTMAALNDVLALLRACGLLKSA